MIRRIVRNLGLGKRLLLASAGIAVVAGPVLAGLVNVPRGEAQAPSSPQAREIFNQAMQAYGEARYEIAIGYLQQVLEIEPTATETELYLGDSHSYRFVPGDKTAQNAAHAVHAIEAFEKVLKRDANNVAAIAGLANVYSKMQEYRKAREYYLRQTRLTPLDPQPFYSVAATNWVIAFNGRPQAPAEEQADLLEEGLRHADVALALDSTFEEAFAYKNLLLRQKAKMTADESEKAKLIAEADRWFQKALEARKNKKTQNNLVAPPPPPPPPPSPPAGSLRRP
jgi:tetratricopeptide (TPR) repeat protein